MEKKNKEIELIIKGNIPILDNSSNNILSIYHLLGKKEEDKNTSETINNKGKQKIDITTLSRQLSLLRNSDLVIIPTKIKKLFDYGYISVIDLRKIDPDIEVAKEMCYCVLSFLEFFEKKYKELNREVLSLFFYGKYTEGTKKKIGTLLNVLVKGTKLKGGIIECDNFKLIGEKSYGYRFSETYFKKGYIKYTLKTKTIQNQHRKFYYECLKKAMNNVIASNILDFYRFIELPSLNDIEAEAYTLVKTKYTRKGKRLVFRGHKSKELDDKKKYKYVEDAIYKYNFLMYDGLMNPKIGNDKSGGRVYDSINSLPSWVRNLITINGERLVELDYSALHPNIAIKLFGGVITHLTHDMVADELKLTKEQVKKAHLSFFNQRVVDMKKNIVYPFYQKYEKDMLEKIIQEKINGGLKIGYKIISKQLFKTEVEIMTSVISKLNAQGVYVGYIFDALMCQEKDKEIVKSVMDETVKEFGVFTNVK